MREQDSDHSLTSLKMQLAALLPEQDGRLLLGKIARLERVLAARAHALQPTPHNRYAHP